jgi:opacity protein-like surface antigen
MRFKLTLAIIAGLAAAHVAVADGRSSDAVRDGYIGIFGGGGVSGDTDISQLGTVFFIEADGGPLAVHASGRLESDSVWFAGVQIGHEWSSGSGVVPAFELEGIYLDTGDRSAILQNPNVRLEEQTFDTVFPTDTSIFLANFALSFPMSRTVTPYVGGGLGGAQIDVDGATSIQLDPAEPGLNHFNAGPDSTAWTFAAQAKAGIRVALGRSAFVFGEYRYLYVGSADLIFGSTMEAGHPATSEWTVRLDDTSHHLGSAGIGFSF